MSGPWWRCGQLGNVAARLQSAEPANQATHDGLGQGADDVEDGLVFGANVL